VSALAVHLVVALAVLVAPAVVAAVLDLRATGSQGA
jgi:hypothetical protein